MEPLVSICCITYNHEKYIRDAIEGFLVQKTNFPIEIIIHDDASTDKTATVIKKYEEKYPDLFICIYQNENQYSKGIKPFRTYVFPKARGKYIAICEGDDYWTDPNKLQKQVDFLEAHPEYGLIHSDLDHFYVKKNKLVKNHWKKNGVEKQSGDIYDSLMAGKNSMIYGCTACFRIEFIKNNERYDDIIKQGFLMGDTPLWLHIASESKIGYLPESTAVRNVTLFSATQGRSFNYYLRFEKSVVEVYEYFDNNIRAVSESIRNIYYSNYHLRVINHCFRARTGVEILRHHYELLDNTYKDLELKIKIIGSENSFFYLISKFALKLIKFYYLYKNSFQKYYHQNS